MIIRKENIINFKQNIYTFCVVLAFSLFFFSNDNTLGLGKLFFIPTAFSLIFSFFITKKIGKSEILLLLFVLFATVPYAVYGTLDVEIIESPITRLILGILSFIGIKDIGIKKLIKWLTIVTPFILIIHYLYSDLSEYRYGGFYGDPNYLAISFQFLIICNLLTMIVYSNKTYKILGTINILGILPLIIFGLSRAGTATTILILLFYFFYLFRRGNKSIYVFIAIGILLLFLFASNLQVLFGERIDSLMERLNDLQDDVRNKINKIALDAFIEDERNIFFGFGYGNTETEKFLEITGYSNHRVHNSYLCVLVEQGFIGLSLLFGILYILIKKIIFSKNKFKIIKIGLLLTMLINLYSVFCFSFLGFWVTYFFLLNDWEDLEDTEIEL